MSRSGYSDDCENLNLWRANVDRALQGKRGQAFLRELLASLDALPEPKLLPEVLVDEEGCCAMGAVAMRRGLDIAQINESEPEDVAGAFGISGVMAAEIAYINDEDGWWGETPEQRFQRVRAWVVAQLRELPTPSSTEP